MSMRAFIAIELPKEISDYLSRLQDKLKTTGADVKWVEPDNIHLTLKFLGEITEAQSKEIIKIMEDTCGINPAFDIALGGLGAFPRITSPRVIWVGIDAGRDEAGKIAQELEDKISGLGIAKEKKEFSAHLTIARTRSAFNITALIQDLKNLAGIMPEQNLRFKASRISLIKSTLTPKGPLYETLREISLKTA